jgi:hypothetical protein
LFFTFPTALFTGRLTSTSSFAGFISAAASLGAARSLQPVAEHFDHPKRLCTLTMGVKMVIRKSNIVNFTPLLATPTFHALAWVECPYNQSLAFVTLREGQEDFSRFLYHDVIIDGERHFCLDVRTFTRGPYLKGDSIGILVAGAQPAANSFA